jgi:type VI secretion system secreted protein VgrG
LARPLTLGEKESLLWPIFGPTLPYDRIRCGVNYFRLGGRGNSIAPMGNPYFSSLVYCDDFSDESKDSHGNLKVSLKQKWIFIHEFTHVWQHYHGANVIRSAAMLFVRCRGRYKNAYTYSLSPEKAFAQFNIEQQAEIIADYWQLTEMMKKPTHRALKARLPEFAESLEAIRRSGSPRSRGRCVAMPESRGDEIV